MTTPSNGTKSKGSKSNLKKGLVVTDVASWFTRNKEIKNELLDKALLEYLQERPDLVERHIKKNGEKYKKLLSKFASIDEAALKKSILDDSSAPLANDLMTLLKEGDFQSILLKLSFILKIAVNADGVKVSLLDKTTYEPIKEYEVFRGRKVIRFYMVWNSIGVITMMRFNNSLPFSQVEQEVAIFIVNNVSTCINLFDNSRKRLNDENIKQMTALLADKELTRSVVINVLKQVREIISADRANLYVSNDKRDEFYPEYIDFGESYISPDKKYSLGKGYCGFAAFKRTVLNLDHAIAKNEIEEIMGINPKNVISYPIEINDEVLGVLQLLRFHSKPFTKNDEKEMEFFIIYLTFILFITNFQKKLEIKDNHLKVSSERLKYHTQVKQEDLRKLMRNPRLESIPMDIDSIKFPFTDYTPEQFPRIVIYLLEQLLGIDIFPMDKMCQFILTVIRHYRDVYYHNVQHAFNVTHCMYLMLKDVKTEFPKLEMKCLMIACICHDLDHRGVDNSFLKLIKAPLSNLYSISILEHHHYNLTISILQDPKSNIFCDLSKEQYKIVLDDLEKLILATDLANFKENMGNIQPLVDGNTFKLNNKVHRKHLKMMMMTGCDISSNCKPLSVLVTTVENLYQEFYAQGDKLRQMDIKPVSMMDRQCQKDIPKDQIGFIRYICLPCFEIIAYCLPKTQPILLGCKQSLQHWESMNQRELSLNIPQQELFE